MKIILLFLIFTFNVNIFSNSNVIVQTDSLLPSKPVIKNIELSYDSYDYKTGYFSNSVFTLTFECEQFDDIWLWLTPCLIEPGDDLWDWFHAGIPIRPTKIDSNTYVFTEEWNSNQRLYIEAYNEYGYSCSDTIWTTDYITDTEILKDLLTDINGLDTTPLISIDDEYILLDACVRKIILYDLNGVKVLTKENINKIEKSLFPEGIYIIKVETQNNKTIVKKIRL